MNFDVPLYDTEKSEEKFNCLINNFKEVCRIATLSDVQLVIRTISPYKTTATLTRKGNFQTVQREIDRFITEKVSSTEVSRGENLNGVNNIDITKHIETLLNSFNDSFTQKLECMENTLFDGLSNVKPGPGSSSNQDIPSIDVKAITEDLKEQKAILTSISDNINKRNDTTFLEEVERQQTSFIRKYKDDMKFGTDGLSKLITKNQEALVDILCEKLSDVKDSITVGFEQISKTIDETKDKEDTKGIIEKSLTETTTHLTSEMDRISDVISRVSRILAKSPESDYMSTESRDDDNYREPSVTKFVPTPVSVPVDKSLAYSTESVAHFEKELQDNNFEFPPGMKSDAFVLSMLEKLKHQIDIHDGDIVDKNLEKFINWLNNFKELFICMPESQKYPSGSTQIVGVYRRSLFNVKERMEFFYVCFDKYISFYDVGKGPLHKTVENTLKMRKMLYQYNPRILCEDANCNFNNEFFVHPQPNEDNSELVSHHCLDLKSEWKCLEYEIPKNILLDIIIACACVSNGLRLPK